MLSKDERELIEKTYREHSFRLIIFFNKYVSDWNASWDLMQEVFVIFIKKIAIVKSHENLTGWLYKTAGYIRINHFRKKIGNIKKYMLIDMYFIPYQI